MAKKNVRDDPSKTQVTENPQMSDIVLVLDKMELLIQAVSEINKNGKYSTVPADKEHQNSFLKIDRYATFFENFLKNFWSQLKDPTHFGLFTMKEEEFDKPEVKQAIEMCSIYSNVLSNTMDAFASIISNNLNIVMKVLTALTIVMALPNMVFGLYGMNVDGLPYPHFWFTLALAGALVLLCTLILWKKDMFK